MFLFKLMEKSNLLLDELSVTDILSYLGARTSSMEEEIRRNRKQLTKAKELLEWALHVDIEHTDSAEFEKKWDEAEQFIKEKMLIV